MSRRIAMRLPLRISLRSTTIPRPRLWARAGPTFAIQSVKPAVGGPITLAANAVAALATTATRVFCTTTGTARSLAAGISSLAAAPRRPWRPVTPPAVSSLLTGLSTCPWRPAGRLSLTSYRY